MPRRYKADPSKGYFQVEWPLFGELSRALALKVAREYDPEIVVGIATAGVIGIAAIAAPAPAQAGNGGAFAAGVVGGL